ncbi:MAG: hypothetical protein AAF411_15670 [Myxococcota bacterium]
MVSSCGDDDGTGSCDPATCEGVCVDDRCILVGDMGTDGDGAPEMGTDGGMDVAMDMAPDEAMCESLVFCGDPPVCCAVGTECIEEACVPTCDTGVRCGGACCDAASDVCVNDACVSPGDECTDSFDCPGGAFCEPTLGRCLPQFDPVACEIEPTFDDFAVTLELELTESDVRPTCYEAISAPVVVDITGDGVPEIIANFGCSGTSLNEGAIRAFAGDTGEELWVSETVTYGRISIAAGDLRGDGNIVIVGVGQNSGSGDVPRRAFALDASGTELWRATSTTDAPLGIAGGNGAPTLADLDGDGVSEILWGGVVLDANGRELFTVGAGGQEGSPPSYTGGIAAVADIDDDGLLDIVTGRSAWERDGTPKWTAMMDDAPILDGYPALAQFDEDPQAEVVLVAEGNVYLLDGATGAIEWGPTPIPHDGVDGNLGGPPTVANFDGMDGPEIGVAGGSSYVVFDPSRDDPVVWTQPTIDRSSNATGSSVFDFEGDGSAEVVYQDECHVWVFSGRTGEVLLQIPSTSATIHEYPLVVDVDADGNSELVTVANAFSSGRTCPGAEAFEGLREGIFVYGDANDRWVRTRQVWNQHAYSVTNVTSSGAIPAVPATNWETPGLNNFRQNVQGEGVFNAPDLQVGLSVRLDRCASSEATLLARVSNEGNLGVAPGVPVVVFAGAADARGDELARGATTVPLLPGASEVLEFVVPLPDSGAATSFVVEVDGVSADASIEECLEDNNEADIEDVRCLLI